MLDCSKLLGKVEFESYSEFYLALCMAQECKRLGLQLDMSMMTIDASVLPKENLVYFKKLVGSGVIYVGSEVPSTTPGGVLDKELDTSCFTGIESVLFEDTGCEYKWSVEWVSNYKNHELTILSRLDVVLMHLLGHKLVNIFLGNCEKKPIRVVINNFMVKTTSLYINPLSCSKTMPKFKESVIMDIDFSDFSVDLDYSIFCNNGFAAGRYKLWSISEKREFMSKCGFVEGAILVLWSRSGMCPSNPIGKIVNSIIVKINEVTDNGVLYYSTIPVNKTKEEVIADYAEIPDDKRYLFSDLLTSKPQVMEKHASLVNFGIDNYFYDEDTFLTKIGSGEVVKRISIDDKTADVLMSEVDAIYWLLCQYEIDFDRELYKKMYKPNSDLLWDAHGTY